MGNKLFGGKAALGGIVALVIVAVTATVIIAKNEQQDVIENLPPPEMTKRPDEPELPKADISNIKGAPPPEATEMTREQKRFARYDRNGDLIITRNEMLSSRSAAFRKLDKDGNNLLSFEEWAVTTANRFDGADSNKDGKLNAREFATTKPKTKPKKKKCRC